MIFQEQHDDGALRGAKWRLEVDCQPIKCPFRPVIFGLVGSKGAREATIKRKREREHGGSEGERKERE